jgi:hypothetical protein
MSARITNEISIRSKLVTAAKKKQYVGIARSAANTRLVFAREAMLAEFDKHPVTKELLQDPSKEGSSLVSHGNLVSFIGFEDASLEVGTVREFLREGVSLGNNPTITNTKLRIDYNFPVLYPSKTQLEEITPAPDNWTSKSWLKLIEEGVGNAASYIFSRVGFSFGESRSGFGLQLKDKSGRTRERKAGGSFTPTKYISEILDNFRKRFK